MSARRHEPEFRLWLRCGAACMPYLLPAIEAVELQAVALVQLPEAHVLPKALAAALQLAREV